MIILGCDPGLRHTGLCILKDGKPVYRDTLVPPGRGKMSVPEVLNYILLPIGKLVEEWEPEFAAVEQVTWYGSGKKITLPLSHVAGAIVGYLVAQGVSTYLIYAAMRKGKVRFTNGKKEPWTEHERDAAELAKTVADYLAGKPEIQMKYLQYRIQA